MRPLKISMKGFGAFREPTYIDLADIDLVAFVGPTGSGKSTIIDAITFALYGTVARYEDNRLVAPAINQTSNEARVSLDFELSGQVFTAVRIVRRTTGGGATTKEARLERGADILAGDARSMSNKVEVLLGLDVEQFNRTVVLPQGKFAAFLHDKPSDRQTTLVQLLGVELYRRIGKAARSRKAVANNQADALRPEYDEVAEIFTDERRAELEDRIVKLNAACARFGVDRRAIDTLDADLSVLDDRIKSLGDQIDRMAKITVPANLAELADQITVATKDQANTEKLRSEQNIIRRLASEAIKAGPDITTVRLGLNAHRALAERTQERDNFAKALKEATSQYESANREANQFRAAQAELVRCFAETRQAEARARDARDAEVAVTQIDAWAKSHNRYEVAAKEVAATADAARSAETALPPLRRALENATSAAEMKSERVAELQRRAGVLGHIDLLEVGEDCPLCLQEVNKLPAHEFDDTEHRQANEESSLARAAVGPAKQAHQDAREKLIELRAKAASALTAAQSYERDIAFILPPGRLNALRAKAIQLAEVVGVAEKATEKAETAARQYRESKTYTKALEAELQAKTRMTQLRASENTLEDQLTSIRDEVAAFLSEKQLRAQLTEAKRLGTELEDADARLNATEAQYQRATTQLAEVHDRREQAIALLSASRDLVATFEPPAIDTTDLVASWTTLTNWAQNQAHTAGTERRAAIQQNSTTADRRARLLHDLRARCETVLGNTNPYTTVEELGLQLVEQRITAKKDLDHFDERRDHLRKLKKRIDNLTEQAQVANKLGHLLRADGFESWVMETALDRLVEQATKRLFVLSNGQYSLEVYERDFFVRDHTNADELRRARTLSGGETFLASLSLALALADTTADISTGDVPTMESIFLDEGFGTLDPHTLDTVAAAVEELGASGRLVGIVTHIRELADRLPVRLELTKTGGSATVERIEN